MAQLSLQPQQVTNVTKDDSKMISAWCGCGKKSRYYTINGMACNKRLRCPETIKPCPFCKQITSYRFSAIGGGDFVSCETAGCFNDPVPFEIWQSQ